MGGLDDFYAVCTNLEGDAKEIIRINKNRWQIESCFKVLKKDENLTDTLRAMEISYISKQGYVPHYISAVIDSGMPQSMRMSKAVFVFQDKISELIDIIKVEFRQIEFDIFHICNYCYEFTQI